MKRLTLMVIVWVVFLVTVGAGDDTSLVAAAEKVKKLAGGMEFTEGRCGCQMKGYSFFLIFPTEN